MWYLRGWENISIFICVYSEVRHNLFKNTSQGPFKRFQRLLQLAFNILLNQMFGAFDQVVQHCWKRKKCWKLVESSLNRFKISFNIDSTFPMFSKMLNGLFKWFQHLHNIRSTFVERMFVKCWNRLNAPLESFLKSTLSFLGDVSQVQTRPIKTVADFLW